MNPPNLSRRELIRLATAASAVAAGKSLFAQDATLARLSVTGDKLATMPQDFTGLSYESPQLANPKFFSPDNTDLVHLYRELSPAGVLRLGGNLSAFTGWRDDPAIPLTAAEQASLDKGKKYWEWDLCDPSISKGNHEAVFTPASIAALAGFLKATGWRAIYGLNFGTGTPEQATAEAACVYKLLGPQLIAFQLGNEIDFWKGGMRGKDWEFEIYYAQWEKWVNAIRARTPGAPFAGPDVAIRLDWMEKLAERQQGKLALLSKHHYAMGPAGDPKQNATRLLGPDPDVAIEIASAKRATAIAGVRFRNTECNSCFHGGQPGVSNAFASALWGCDFMLTLAQGGHGGVNLHGGGDGIYSPIVGDRDRGFTRRPLYYGMQLAQSFAGATFVEAKLDAGKNNANAYVARRGRQTLVAIVNKDVLPLRVTLDAKMVGKAKLTSVGVLSAPSLKSQNGVSFTNSPAAGQLTGAAIELAPYSAQLLTFNT